MSKNKKEPREGDKEEEKELNQPNDESDMVSCT